MRGGDLLRIGRALRTLPSLADAMKAGDVTWTKAREVVKVATPDTEAGWVERAEGLTTRELQRVVRSKQRGDDAPGPEEPLPPEPVVLRFE